MGLITTLFGYINEPPSIENDFINHNNQTIHQLTEKIDIEWPPLSKEMFHIVESNSNGPILNYWGRIITIGASLKGVEHEWEEWLNKFEHLLQNIYWSEAKIILQTEWYGQMKYEWKVKANVDVNKFIPKHNEWDFRGSRRNIIG